MFLLDKPFVSDFLKKTLCDNTIPVIATDIATALNLPSETTLISEADAISLVKQSKHPILYTNSENAIAWISENLAFSSLPKKIELFKNKVKFRDLTKPLFPEFYYKEVLLNDLK